MKTGNVSQGGMFYAQTKSLREDKAADKKEQSKAIEEKVDLSTKRASVTATAAASCDDVVELLHGIDFSQFKDLEWISKEGTARFTELLQS